MEPEDFEFQLQAQKQYGATTATQQAASGSTYTDQRDGTVYEWDAQRQGWFPKIDDNFLATYQASYGINYEQPQDSNKDGQASPSDLAPPTTAVSTEQSTPVDTQTSSEKTEQPDASLEEPSPKKKKPNEKEPPKWFDIDEKKNHNVYVSGLPDDVTLEEFAELMSKYGIIMENEDGSPKLKLYRDKEGHLKGDGLCCYLKVESVQLAIQLLHETTYKDHKIYVEKAHFEMKGQYNPSLKKKKKNAKKRGKQQRMLDWVERKTDGAKRLKNEKIVIFKRVFDPKEFEEDPTLITDIKSDLQEECGKFGTVKKILVFDRHPDGVVSLAFKEYEAADQCVTAMNNRWYSKRQLEVSHWDGLTDFQVEETDKEREERLQNWEKFLEGSTGEET